MGLTKRFRQSARRFASRSACVSASFEYPWRFAVSSLSPKLLMHLRFVISLIVAAISTPPFFGRKDPERMSADDVKALVEDTEIDGPLADWKTKGSTVEYLGTEDVDGTPAHKLKVVRKNGDVSFVYLDPDHFLEIRIVTQRMRHGAHEEVETDLGDYEKAGGVFVPTSIEVGRKGAPDKQMVVIDKVEANVPVDDTIFHFPGQISIPQPQR